MRFTALRAQMPSDWGSSASTTGTVSAHSTSAIAFPLKSCDSGSAASAATVRTTCRSDLCGSPCPVPSTITVRAEPVLTRMREFTECGQPCQTLTLCIWRSLCCSMNCRMSSFMSTRDLSARITTVARALSSEACRRTSSKRNSVLSLQPRMTTWPVRTMK